MGFRALAKQLFMALRVRDCFALGARNDIKCCFRALASPELQERGRALGVGTQRLRGSATPIKKIILNAEF